MMRFGKLGWVVFGAKSLIDISRTINSKNQEEE